MKEELKKRFSYHTPMPEQVQKYADIRSKALELALLLNDLCPSSRELSLAYTKLEEVVMHANASIARNGDKLFAKQGTVTLRGDV